MLTYAAGEVLAGALLEGPQLRDTLSPRGCRRARMLRYSILLCVLILLDMCPHTTRYMSQYSTRSDAELQYTTLCPHTTVYVSSYSTRSDAQLQYATMCPHTTTYLSSYNDMCPHAAICFLILLHMRPHSTIYVTLHYYICVLILLSVCPHTLYALSPRWCRMLTYADVC
jgi:hypothetical protein